MKVYKKCLILIMLVFSVNVFAAVEKPRDTVNSLIDAIHKDLPTKENSKDFYTYFALLADKYFAVDSIAQWYLGQDYKKLSDAQKDRYKKVTKEFLIYSYGSIFRQNYQNFDINIKNIEMQTDTKAVVHIRLTPRNSDNTPPIDTQWNMILRKGDQRFLIVDIIFNNLSLRASQRGGILKDLSSMNGDYDKFIDLLQVRVDEIKNNQKF